jgi:3-hydroxy-D-aspartate aldolase
MAEAEGAPRPGLALEAVETPALAVDLDAMERNLRRMAERARAAGVRLRAHAKTHRSSELARLQMEIGGAVGVCCQKVGEAEVMVAGGVGDVLITNEVVDPRKMARAAGLARAARVQVVLDDPATVEPWAAAAREAGVELSALVEIDAGSGFCGVDAGPPAAALAGAIASADGLRFAGLQAYYGAAQHVRDAAERRARIEAAAVRVRDALAHLEAAGLDCPMVGGGGTGSWEFEAATGLWDEVQCGSYLFMDADYRKVEPGEGQALGAFEPALFVLATVMSKARPGIAVCDAGLKVQSLESGPPRVHGVDGVEVRGCSDEHGFLLDPEDRLRLGDRLFLIPGHCDPTVNLHDRLVGFRDGRVERPIEVDARGRSL